MSETEERSRLLRSLAQTLHGRQVLRLWVRELEADPRPEMAKEAAVVRGLLRGVPGARWN